MLNFVPDLFIVNSKNKNKFKMSDTAFQRTPSTKQKGCDLLVREDFDAGPTNLDCIEPGLWLGNLTAATTETVLSSHKINHILTIDSCPLPRNITLIYGMKTKFIQVTDHPREDLLTFLEDTYEFIKQGIENGAILVHCYFGVSRSAAIVIAFTMKKYQLTFNEALERVKSQRRFVGPNPGFESQLKLFELMGWQIDKKNLQYRLFRLQIAADNVKKVKILPQNCLDVIKPDPSLITVRPDPLVYRCRKCRRIVASASNIVPHVPKEKPNWTHTKWTTDKESLTLCSDTFFIEPLAWMPAIHHSTEGKIHCPKCSSKLGSFSWTMGCQCPCGAKVSPAFYLVPSKVEWSNRVQNVQVTL